MSLFDLPALPPARGYENTGTLTLLPRFEDVTQTDAVQLHALLPGIVGLWKTAASAERLEAMRRAGVLPIFRRIVAVREPGPFSANVPITTTTEWRLARDDQRFFLNVWLTARAPHARTQAPMPSPDAPMKVIGRVFAEHVLTRPFVPTNERKVTELSIEGLPRVPEDRHDFALPEALLEGKDLTRANDAVFGPMHTDPNRHVNSLVYPRLFEERVVERLAERRSPRAFLAEAIDIRFRKPFFAGDRAEIAFALEDNDASTVTAVGCFRPPGAERPSAAIALRVAE